MPTEEEQSQDEELISLLEQATFDVAIECPECYTRMEADAEKCQCGWINRLRAEGFI